VAEEALKLLRKNSRIAVFCGRGSNGGDGFVAARHLLCRGIKCDIFLAGLIKDVANEAKINLDLVLKLKHKVIEVTPKNLSAVKKKAAKYNFIIDALLGIGPSSEIKGLYRDLIEMVNASGAFVLAADMPSGLDPESGKILGCCVKADKTVTFVARKRGMTVKDGPKFCGKIVVRDLGIPL
jgi:hydroxyethylthiazole kinase-like uncharacterized protein yjeF